MLSQQSRACGSGVTLQSHLNSEPQILLLSVVYTGHACTKLSVQPAEHCHAVAAGEDTEGVSCGHAGLLGPRPAAGPHPR